MSGVVSSVGKVIGTFTGSTQQAEAGKKAADVQSGMAQAGMTEERRQFDKLIELMSPYVTAGKGAMEQQQAILGLQGAEAQKAAYAGIQQSPEFLAMQQQGENALLQQASATGGLRGGNIQGALAQFRPGLLNQLVQQRYTNLGGITSLGQASAAGQAGAGMQSAGAIANLLAQQGAAQAGGIMAKGGLQKNVFGDLMSIAGAYTGSQKGTFGTSQTGQKTFQ
ncbi:MAG: hypothetical protein LW839_08575 [Cryomorphaceae bacterium]|jgi:hypothetical protein|nr:hypothetical protein [Cryomorphaceae bacterium]